MNTPGNDSGFREEALDLLVQLESFLLELEREPENRELIDQVFRIMHTIKGSGSMFGFDDVVTFVHEIETVYDHVRSGRLRVTSALINRTLQARDQIKLLVTTGHPDEPANIALIGQLITEFRAMSGSAPTATVAGRESRSSAEEPSVPPLQASSTGETGYWHIHFAPKPGFFLNGSNPMGLLNELATLGQTRVRVSTESVPPLQELDPESCHLVWDIDIRTDAGLNAIKDVFIFVEETAQIDVTPIDSASWDAAADPALPGASELDPPPITTPPSQSDVPPRGQREDDIGAGKLDRIVELIGELVTVQARLNQLATQREDSELLSIAEELNRLSTNLRDNALKARMVPVSTVFDQFHQHLQEIATQNGKEIDPLLSGGETELDKDILNRLLPPLRHLLRLVTTHSIERPDQRKDAGKEPRAQVHISAHHFGGNFCIEIQDDGQGFAPEFLSDRARALGLNVDGNGMSSPELLRLLCHPGFLPEGGLASVKAVIDELRGSIDVENHPGKGLGFTLRLPLTLSIIEGLVVALGTWLFVLPLAAVEECIELTRQDEELNYRKNVIMVRDRIVPYIPLREKFGIAGAPPEIQQVVIVGIGQHRVGFVVDQVIGEFQTVIKPLGKIYKDVSGISGASILGDGTVALIIDLTKIILEEQLHEFTAKGA
ncbi:MAG TPA: chemotaxis protein CheA [Candidatus Ozemobacteraceae bacterium]